MKFVVKWFLRTFMLFIASAVIVTWYDFKTAGVTCVLGALLIFYTFYCERRFEVYTRRKELLKHGFE